MNDTDFADMRQTGGQNDEDDYDLQNFESFDFEDAGDTVVGELLKRIEEVGKYESTVYLLESDGEKVMVWGNGSIDAAYDAADDEIEVGDMVGFQKTDRTYENEYGEFAQYDVRYQKA
jgi:hypothetical protein